MGVIRDFLDQHLHGKASPFLFVGSGLSRRYTGLDDWEGLLRLFAEETGRQYEYFKATASGDLPQTASQIAPEFHEVWWTKRKFATSRAEWKDRTTGPQSALKIEIARHVARATERVPTSGPLAAELELLRVAVVDGIITTNYDLLLEHLFSEFRVFVGQDQMLFSNPQGVGEIYKIHGSCEEPDSLVLTAEDYERYEERNAYLAAKLLTTFVEHPVIFLGYSISDRNVQSVLRSIAGCLTERNIGELRDRLVFVQWQANGEPTVGQHTFLIDGFTLNVVRIQVSDFLEVFESLAHLSRTFPAELLRRLKEHVYSLVLTDDPRSQLVVADIDSASSTDVDVVFGVGMKERLGRTGYVGLNRWNLIDDVISGAETLNAKSVVEEALPLILRSPGNVPTFKYLRGAGLLTRAGQIRKGVDVPARVARMAEKHRGGDPATQHHSRVAPARLKGVTGIANLEKRSGRLEVLNYATCLSDGLVDVAELRSFLQDNDDLRQGTWEGTQFAKLACYLDWLEFGRASPTN